MRRSTATVAIVLMAAFACRKAERADSRPGKPGISASAAAALQRADARMAAADYAGALDAYIDAVRSDRAVADLARIDRYAARTEYLPPGTPAADRQAFEQKVEKAKPRWIAALRQYLELKPGDFDATARLAALTDPAEAESLLGPVVEARPRDAEVYRTRATIRAKNGDFERALDDYDRARDLDPRNAEGWYVAGAAGYDMVTKREMPDPQKARIIARSLAELEQAEAMKPGYYESMAYHSLLIRQQALLEKDRTKRKKLEAEADALHRKAADLVKHATP